MVFFLISTCINTHKGCNPIQREKSYNPMKLEGLENHNSLLISILPLDKIEIQSHPIDLIINKISTTIQMECLKTKLFLAFQMLQQTKNQIKAKKDDFTLPSKEFDRNKSTSDFRNYLNYLFVSNLSKLVGANQT